MTNVFENQYQDKGLNAQRKYPNTSLISSIAPLFFKVPKKERKSIKILDLGCGSGANLWMMAKEGFDSYGLDYAPTGIGLCQEMLNHWGVNATLTVGDMTNLPYENNTFDLIFDVVSSQHLNFKQHTTLYNEVYRCLKPEGVYYSFNLGDQSISLKSSDKHIDHCTIENIEEGYPLAGSGQTCFISRDEIEKLLSDSGFKNTSTEEEGRTYNNGTQYIEYLSTISYK